MSNIDRYTSLAITAIEIHQLRLELKTKMRELGHLLNVDELMNRRFVSEDADNTLSILKDRLDFSPNGGSTDLKYRDVSFFFFPALEHLSGREVLCKLLDDIKAEDIARTVKI